jgi:hypothetical protein
MMPREKTKDPTPTSIFKVSSMPFTKVSCGGDGKGQVSRDEMGMRMAAVYGLQEMEGIEGMGDSWTDMGN